MEFLDDDYLKHSPCIKSVDFRTDIKLPEIFIPSQVLESKYVPRSADMSKPAFRTLEKVLCEKSFTSYFDKDFSKRNKTFILNDVNETFDKGNSLNETHNRELDINADKDLTKFALSLLSNEASVEPNTSESAVLSRDHQLFDDSLEKVYASDDNENLFLGSNFDNMESVSNLIEIFGENSSSPEEISTGEAATLQSDVLSTAIPTDPCKKIGNILEDIASIVDSLDKSNENNEALVVDQLRSSEVLIRPHRNDKSLKDMPIEPDLFDQMEENEDSKASSVVEDSRKEVKLVNFPIAYKRPTLSDSSSKQKPLKGKKEKKLKNLPLAEFYENCPDGSVEERDLFYESIKYPKSYYKPYVSEFPALYKDQITMNKTDGDSSKIKTNVGQEKVSSPPKQLKNSRFDSGKNVCPEYEHLQLKKIFIKNVPKHVTQEEMMCLLTVNGSIEYLNLEPDGEFQKATFCMSNEDDIEWTVLCLNGNNPFGAAVTVPLKCYQE